MTPNELKRYRIKMFNRTQKSFASLMGVNQNTVSDWETGKSKIPKWLILFIKHYEKCPLIQNRY